MTTWTARPPRPVRKSFVTEQIFGNIFKNVNLLKYYLAKVSRKIKAISTFVTQDQEGFTKKGYCSFYNCDLNKSLKFSCNSFNISSSGVKSLKLK